MNNKFKRVEVKWLDAQTGFAAAMPIPDFKKVFEPLYNYSYGYLLEDNDKYIILGFLLMDYDNDGPEDTLVKHWQLIPKGMVKNVKELK